MPHPILGIGDNLEPRQPGKVGHELAMNLRCAYLSMHRATNACFAEYGLSADSFSVLMTLAMHESMTQKELMQRIGSDANTVSAMTVRLERMKLVARKRDTRDGRVRIVELTAKGRQVQEELWEKSQPLRFDLESAFQPQEIQNVITSLKRIAQVMNND